MTLPSVGAPAAWRRFRGAKWGAKPTDAAQPQGGAARWLCCGWNPWLNAWLTTSSAITRACHASARRSRPWLPPAASYTLCMPPDCQPAPECAEGPVAS